MEASKAKKLVRVSCKGTVRGASRGALGSFLTGNKSKSPVRVAMARVAMWLAGLAGLWNR
jgi:hypothetical protein